MLGFGEDVSGGQCGLGVVVWIQGGCGTPVDTLTGAVAVCAPEPDSKSESVIAVVVSGAIVGKMLLKPNDISGARGTGKKIVPVSEATPESVGRSGSVVEKLERVVSKSLVESVGGVVTDSETEADVVSSVERSSIEIKREH